MSGWEVGLLCGRRPGIESSLCLLLSNELVAWDSPSAVYISYVVGVLLHKEQVTTECSTEGKKLWQRIPNKKHFPLHPDNINGMTMKTQKRLIE